GLEEGCERSDHSLEVGDWLLKPPDSIDGLRSRHPSGGRCSGRNRRLRFCRRLSPLCEARSCGEQQQKRGSCQESRQARSAALNRSGRGHEIRALSEFQVGADYSRQLPVATWLNFARFCNREQSIARDWLAPSSSPPRRCSAPSVPGDSATSTKCRRTPRSASPCRRRWS